MSSTAETVPSDDQPSRALESLMGPLVPVMHQLTRLVVLLFMVTTLLFFMLRLAGDPALVLAGNDATPEQLEAIINSPAPLDFGLDIENFRYRVPLNDRFGIEVVDVRIKRADFPSNVSSSVFDRMRAERERIASAERAEGAQIDLEKRADVDRQVEIITQTAQGDSARIRGEAEGEAIGILAEQLGRDEEFYAFTRSLEAYKALLAQDSTLILNVDSDLWRYLESPSLPADR